MKKDLNTIITLQVVYFVLIGLIIFISILRIKLQFEAIETKIDLINEPINDTVFFRSDVFLNNTSCDTINIDTINWNDFVYYGIKLN